MARSASRNLQLTASPLHWCSGFIKPWAIKDFIIDGEKIGKRISKEIIQNVLKGFYHINNSYDFAAKRRQLRRVAKRAVLVWQDLDRI